MRALDGIVYSSLLVAAAAGCLAAAVGSGLAGRVPLAVPALAFCGTLAIYNLDRLRDLERDRARAPRRSAFVAAHRGGLAGIAGLAAVACLPLAVGLGPPAVAVVAPALLLGLVHRRIKGLPALKPLYLSVSWALVVVGMPLVVTGGRAGSGWIGGVVVLSLLANAIAANAAGAAPLWAARAAAALAAALAGLGPAPLRPLLAVPLATLLALLPFRAGERYRLAVLDGALALGAALAWAGFAFGA